MATFDFRLLSLFSAALALSIMSAHAASFDCKAAKAAQERFICNNAELSRLDEDMAAAYRKHLGQLSEKARALVQESQRSWLAYWPRACSASAGKVELGARELSCAVDSYGARLSELQPRVTVQGMLAYNVSESRFTPPKERDGQPARNDLSYPQFDALPGKPAPTWLAPLNAWLARDRVKWRSSLDGQSDGSLSVFVNRTTPEAIHAIERNEFYGHGAAHPLTWVSHHHFLIEQRRELRASDIFNGEAWREPVARRVLADLKKQLGDDLQVAGLKELIEIIGKPSSWDFSAGKLELHFNPYEVAPYSRGFLTAEVPAAELHPHLTALGRRLLSPERASPR